MQIRIPDDENEDDEDAYGEWICVRSNANGGVSYQTFDFEGAHQREYKTTTINRRAHGTHRPTDDGHVHSLIKIVFF